MQSSRPQLQLLQHLQDSAKANSVTIGANGFRPIGTISSPQEVATSGQDSGNGLHAMNAFKLAGTKDNRAVERPQSASCCRARLRAATTLHMLFRNSLN